MTPEQDIRQQNLYSCNPSCFFILVFSSPFLMSHTDQDGVIYNNLWLGARPHGLNGMGPNPDGQYDREDGQQQSFHAMETLLTHLRSGRMDECESSTEMPPMPLTVV
jgi:hypothetical protein